MILFMAFRLRLASSSDWPPDKKLMPHRAGTIVRLRVLTNIIHVIGFPLSLPEIKRTQSALVVGILFCAWLKRSHLSRHKWALTKIYLTSDTISGTVFNDPPHVVTHFASSGYVAPHTLPNSTAFVYLSTLGIRALGFSLLPNLG